MVSKEQMDYINNLISMYENFRDIERSVYARTKLTSCHDEIIKYETILNLLKGIKEVMNNGKSNI